MKTSIMKRILWVCVCVALLATACGGRAEIYDEGAIADAQRGLSLPEPIPATPVFVATVARPLSVERVGRLEETPGVAVAAPVTIKKVPVRGPAGRRMLRVAQVDPLVFRPVAPPSTRDADFVWTSLLLGQTVPTAEAAESLGLRGGGEITIDGDPGYQVGAFADNGVPNIADVLVQATGGDRALNLGKPTLFVIGAESGVTIQKLRRDLRETLPGARIRRLIPQATVVPAAPTAPAQARSPQLVGRVEGGVVGSMRFQVLENGFIRPDPAWVAANIVGGNVPILGRVTCHRLMIPRLAGALGEIQEAGLAHLIRPGDYGGCYVPRFIDRNPRRPLSNHAFGLAVDINVSTNQLGTRGDMDPRIIQIFSRWGFNWGGVWSRPDPMHFELVN